MSMPTRGTCPASYILVEGREHDAAERLRVYYLHLRET
jgi:hypothetical protein